ncbi:MAG: hypothetical protein ACI8PT_000124 [Gammaproteobacteria bacterium]|jgi:hypothetical protein
MHRAIGDDYGRTRIDKAVPQSPLAQLSEHRHRDGAELGGPEVAHRCLQALWQDHRHPIARCDAIGRQHVGHSVGQSLHLGEVVGGDVAIEALIDQRWRVGHCRCVSVADVPGDVVAAGQRPGKLAIEGVVVRRRVQHVMPPIWAGASC